MTMRVAGDRRPRYALAEEPSGPVYEFTVARTTTFVRASFRFQHDRDNAPVVQARTQARDVTAIIRATTAAEAIAAFEAATGECSRNISTGIDPAVVARVDVHVTAFRQVTP